MTLSLDSGMCLQVEMEWNRIVEIGLYYLGERGEGKD